MNRKRISAVVLSAVMLIGLLVGTMLAVNAANDLTTVNSGVPDLDLNYSGENGTIRTDRSTNMQTANGFLVTADGKDNVSASGIYPMALLFAGRLAGNAKPIKTDANTYTRVWHGVGDTVNTGATGGYAYISINSDNGASKGNRYADNDLMTVDFDYTVDRYVYTEDFTYTPEGASESVTIPKGTLTDAPIAGAKYDLATASQGFSVMTRCIKSDNETYVFFNVEFKMEMDSATGLYSLVAGGNKMPLSNKVGHWNHITVVYDIDNRVEYEGGTAPVHYAEYEDMVAALAEGTEAPEITKYYLSNSKVHVYLDGSHVGSFDLIKSNQLEACQEYMHKISASEIRIDYPGAASYTSQGFDNIAINYYANGYKGPAGVAFADHANPPKTLAGLSDVIYTESYKVPAPNSENAAAITRMADGVPKTTYYRTLMGAVANLQANDVLTLASGVNFAKIDVNVPFYLVRDNTSFVSLAAGSAYTLEETYDGSVLYVTNDPAGDIAGVTTYKSGDFSEFLTKDLLLYCSAATSQATLPNTTETATTTKTVPFFQNILVTAKSNGVLQSGKTDDGSNGYLRFWFDPTKTDMMAGTSHDTGFDIYYAKDGNNNPDSIALVNNKYIVLNVDLMSDRYVDESGSYSATPTDKLAYEDSFTFGSFSSGFTDDQHWSSSLFGNARMSTKYDTTAKQWYLDFNGTNVGFLSKTAGEWNHITMVIAIDNTVTCSNGLTVPYSEAVAKGYTINTVNLANTKIKVYVNGVANGSSASLFNTAYSYTDPSKVYQIKIETDKKDENEQPIIIITDHSYDQIMLWRQRVTVTDNKNADYYSIAFDNGSIQYYDDTYTGSLDALFRDENGGVSINPDFDENRALDKNHVGGVSYGFPGTNQNLLTAYEPTGVYDINGNAIYGGKGYDYYNIEYAMSTLVPNSIIVVEDGKAITGIVPECEFTVLLGEGSSFALASDVFNYKTVATEGGLRVVENTKDVHITYKYDNGTEIETQDWYVNQALEFVAVNDLDDPKNPIYNLGAVYYYDGQVIDETHSFDTAGDYTITVKMEKIVLDVEYYFNFDIAYKFVSNFYIPLTDTDGKYLVSSVKCNGNTYTGGTSIGDGDGYVNISDKTLYTKIQSYPSPTAINTVPSYTLTFVINGEEYTTEKIKTYSMATYLKKVIELYGSDTYTKKLAVNTARYCDEIIKFRNNSSTYNSNVTSIWMPNGVVSDLVINTESETVMNLIKKEAEFANITGDITTYIKGATYHMGSADFPCFALIPQNPSDVLSPDDKTDYVIKSVRIDYMGFMNEGAKYTYLYEDCAPGTADDGESFGQRNSRNTGYLVNLNDNIDAYYIRSNYTIKIYLKDGGVVSCTYNLAKYIVETEDIAKDSTEASNAVAKALWAYSYASGEYMANNYNGPSAN